MPTDQSIFVSCFLVPILDDELFAQCEQKGILLKSQWKTIQVKLYSAVISLDMPVTSEIRDNSLDRRRGIVVVERQKGEGGLLMKSNCYNPCTCMDVCIHIYNIDNLGVGGFCPRGILSGGILSGGILTGGILSGGILSCHRCEACCHSFN